MDIAIDSLRNQKLIENQKANPIAGSILIEIYT